MWNFINRTIAVFLIAFSLLFCTDRKQVREYYPDGKLKREFEVDKKGNMEGVCVEFYNTGDTMGINTYKSSKLHGQMVRYHTNGVISVRGQFRNGVEIGWFDIYDEKNRLFRKIQFGIKDDTLQVENQSIAYTSRGTIDVKNSRYFILEKNVSASKKDSIFINAKLIVPKDDRIRVGILVLNLPNGESKYIDMNNSLETSFYVPSDSMIKFNGHILERYLYNDSIWSQRYFFNEKDLKN